ncbi:YHS domain-containing protein [Dermacoccus abyssi]|uniref:YHS domain-containing protein n=1 Tax=Dermacoccus TaxID=57495 RepID=UPI0021A47957|nr:YHS domain-containing protein [Dermacoccus abyssi]MCT1987350.1 YHS domain-containing protein [Dermacoccus abyssi]
MTNESQAPTGCCCSTSVAETNAVAADGREDLLAGGDDDMTTCPVMVGSAVSKTAAEAQGLFRDYDGKRYWFCCAGCGPTFDSDPATYAANVA